MTQTLGANANNDIYLGNNGNIVLLQGQSAVEGACKSTSRASLGEEVLQFTSGLPFFQAVFVGTPNLAIFENSLRQALEAVDGVTAVTALNTQVSKNQQGRSVLRYQATIQNKYGLTATITGESPPA